MVRIKKNRNDVVKPINVTIERYEDDLGTTQERLKAEAIELRQGWHGILEAYGLPKNAKAEEVAYAVCGNERNFKVWFRHHGAKQLLLIDTTMERIFTLLNQPNLNAFDLGVLSNALKSLSTASFNMQKVMYEIIGIAKLEGKVEVNVHSPAEKYTQNIIDLANDDELMNTIVVDEAEVVIE